jgi:hypothetical protein
LAPDEGAMSGLLWAALLQVGLVDQPCRRGLQARQALAGQQAPAGQRVPVGRRAPVGQRTLAARSVLVARGGRQWPFWMPLIR